jgi:hypothetical protein
MITDQELRKLFGLNQSNEGSKKSVGRPTQTYLHGKLSNAEWRRLQFMIGGLKQIRSEIIKEIMKEITELNKLSQVTGETQHKLDEVKATI